MRLDKPWWKRSDRVGFVAMTIAFCLLAILPGMNRPTLLSCLFLATFVSLCSALGFWLGFELSPFRVLQASAVLLVLDLAMCGGFRGPPMSAQFPLFGLFGTVTLLTVAVPIWGVRWVTLGRLEECVGSDQEITVDALQFSILQILLLMTGVGVFAGVAKAVLSLRGTASSSPNEWLLVTQMGLTMGICSVIVVWATLGRDAIRRTIVSVGVAASLALLNAFLALSPIVWIWAGVTLAVWAEITILMWLVRSEGYRFVSDRNEGKADDHGQDAQ